MAVWRRVAAATLAAAVTLAGTACTGTREGRSGAVGASAGAPATFRPGADGIGDPYFPRYGNGGYDVGHYALKVRYDPAADQLSGTAVITAKATADLSRFNLDLAGLTVRQVTVDGRAARHERTGDELVVTPASGVPTGVTFTVQVTYDGKPAGLSRPGLGATGFLHTTDGAIAIGQPESATTWYPVNDHPLDKATYAIEITAPEPLAVLSNGVLAATTRSAGWRTARWEVRSPMASYLSTLAIGDYRVVVGRHKGKPMVTAVAASLPRGPADTAIARTGEVADFLEQRFGPYPFDSYGGIVIDDERVAFALETRPGRCTRRRSSSAARTGSWRTRSPTSGSGTASRSSIGRTSGSTRASPPMASGCGSSTTPV